MPWQLQGFTVELLREEHPGFVQGLSVSLLAWLRFSVLLTRGCLRFSGVVGLLVLVSDAYGLAVVGARILVVGSCILRTWSLCRFSMRKAFLCKMRKRSGP